MKRFKRSSCNAVFFYELFSIFADLPVLFNIFFFKWRVKWRRIWNPVYSIRNDFLCCFWKWSLSQHCFDFDRRCETRLWKWHRCFDVVYRCSFKRWYAQCWFDVLWQRKFHRWYTQRRFNVDLTLSNVVLHIKQKTVETMLKCLLGKI